MLTNLASGPLIGFQRVMFITQWLGLPIALRTISLAVDLIGRIQVFRKHSERRVALAECGSAVEYCGALERC